MRLGMFEEIKIGTGTQQRPLKDLGKINIGETATGHPAVQ
jgi:hypothetical protein